LKEKKKLPFNVSAKKRKTLAKLKYCFGGGGVSWNLTPAKREG
jgi:hypothetical protein